MIKRHMLLESFHDSPFLASALTFIYVFIQFSVCWIEGGGGMFPLDIPTCQCNVSITIKSETGDKTAALLLPYYY